MNTSPLFVTGASGLVGRAVLRCLTRRGRPGVRWLSRGAPAPGAPDLPWDGPVSGTLETLDEWHSSLPSGGVVLHLAARTGKARAREHDRVNADATRRLVEACEASGVRRFVFVSSIAATFPDRRAYPYARAKAEAEAHLRRSGLEWVVARPTQVFGPGSPVEQGLRKLASGPVGLRFGPGRTQLQPIHVTDVARALTWIVDAPSVGPQAFDLGGPDRILVADLLKEMRRAVRGRPGPWLQLPLSPLRALLAVLEPVALPILPLTAGQLASFVTGNDGVVMDPPPKDLPAPRVSLAQMLASPGAHG